MNENLVLKSTVTGKRQITIPKEICELLNIETGQQVVFKKEGNKITFEKEKEHGVCFACNGTTKIEEHECFVCKGNGIIEKDIVVDIYKLIFFIGMTSKKYDVGYSLIQQELDKNGNFQYKDFPIIKLKSNKFSENELLRVQDEIQKLIIEEFTPKSIQDNSLFCIPSDSMLELILETLSTEKAKEEVTKWFRYERTNW